MPFNAAYVADIPPTIPITTIMRWTGFSHTGISLQRKVHIVYFCSVKVVSENFTIAITSLYKRLLQLHDITGNEVIYDQFQQIQEEDRFRNIYICNVDERYMAYSKRKRILDVFFGKNIGKPQFTQRLINL